MELKAKTMNVELAGVSWQIRRMTPAVGSYIWQRLMAAMYKVQAAQPAQEQEPKVEEPAAKTTVEEKLRLLCGISLMQFNFEDLEFTQKAAMRVVNRMEDLPGGATPMPVMTDDGRYIPELADDPFMVTRLTVEALVFNLASFLSESFQAGTQSNPVA